MYSEEFKKGCLYQLMELIVKHIIDALNSLVVTQRSLYGTCKLLGNVQSAASTDT